jgi:hypothetical protein
MTRASNKTRRMGDYGPLEPPSQAKYGHGFLDEIRIEGTKISAVQVEERGMGYSQSFSKTKNTDAPWYVPLSR